MSKNLQNFVKFQKFQLENLVDFEKCCKTHIFLEKSEPIQPRTSNILPKFCQKLATNLPLPPPISPGSRCTHSAWALLPRYDPGVCVCEPWIRICVWCVNGEVCWYRQTLGGSFSAVSRPTFTTTYLLLRIF